MSQLADHVKGTKEFDRIYQMLKRQDSTAAMAPYFVRKYGISNLWKFNMSRGARLVYTLLSESGLWVVVVLEMFLTHKEYEKRFGYC